jgi:capsular polysaccharide biosynthesis protein
MVLDEDLVRSILTTDSHLGQIELSSNLDDVTILKEAQIISPDEYSNYYIAIGVGVILALCTGFGLHHMLEIGETSGLN